MARIIIAVIFAFLPMLAAAAPPPGDARAIERAIDKARRGDTVTVAPGAYDIADLKIRRDLNLVGDGDVVFFSAASVGKGLLNPVDGAALRVENITFKDARSPDLNGAGIRNDGGDLTIVNCRFIDNDDGVLATGDENGVIDIVGATFIGNGHGDGYSHGIYVLNARELNIRDSHFIGTKIGHHVKSLAAVTIITGTEFDDADGRASYAVDLSRGGDATISNNSFLKAADADNNALINYDLSRGGEAQALRITDNRILNRHRSGLLLRNATELVPDIERNVIVNEAGGRMAGGRAADESLRERVINALSPKPAAHN